MVVIVPEVFYKVHLGAGQESHAVINYGLFTNFKTISIYLSTTVPF